MDTAPDFQKVMGWRTATTLFLVGVGAGAYLIGFVFNMIFPGFTAMSRIAIALAAPVVLVGALLTISDMARKREFFRVYMRPQSSWMSRGAIFMTVFIILALVHTFTWVWPSSSLAGAEHLTLGIITCIFAVLCLVYTGMLLGVIKSVALWNGVFLPVLFLISGLSIGTMAPVLGLALSELGAGSLEAQTLDTVASLARFNFLLIIIEGMVFGLYLGSKQALGTVGNPVTALTRGKMAPAFWVGVVTVALVIPFILEAVKGYASIGPAAMLGLTVASSVIGLAGGFMLRYVIVYGGTRVPLNVRGVAVPAPPEEYKVNAIQQASYSSFQKR